MREVVLLAPGANESELKRTMARFGKPSIGLRVMNGPQLARFALMRAGQPIPENILSREDELSLIAQGMQGVSYFGQPGLSDIRNVAATLRQIRQMAVDGEKAEADIVRESLYKGPFIEKNKALCEVYEKYSAQLRDGNLTDGIALMRKAAAPGITLNAELAILEEYPLSSRESILAEKLSGEKSRRLTLPELFGTEEKPLRIASIRNCYGIRAEAETVLCELRDGKTSLDTCTVAVSDVRSYSQLFFDLHLEYAVPITFGCGIPIGNSFPAELLGRYVIWATKGFFGGEALKDMLFSRAFDLSRLPESVHECLNKKKPEGGRDFLSVLTGLRLTNDPAVNRERVDGLEKALTEDDNEKAYLPALKDLAGELALPVPAFMRKYARLRPAEDAFPGSLLHRLDAAALSEIIGQLDLAQAVGQGADLAGLEKQILARNVCRESSRSGAFHLCGIPEAMNCIRKNLHVLGLSASLYPGSPRENHLLLDEDIMAFPSNPKERTSGGKIRQKQDDLKNLLRAASALDCRITLSYAGYDTAELKKANASSLLYELYAKASGKAADIDAFQQAVIKIGYFDHSLSSEREIGRAVMRGAQVLPENGQGGLDKPANDEQESPVILGMDKEYSPSALSAFYQCPRRFYLKSLLGIPEPEEEKPFEIIGGADTGTLAHSLMEILGERAIGKDVFLSMSGDAFDRYIAKHPPLTRNGLTREREEFLEIMERAYEQDAVSERTGIELSEEEIHAVHEETGIKLHGLPDRVEKIDDRTMRIVDFKTSRQKSFVENDIDTCLQAVIYAYMMEEKMRKDGKDVSAAGGEFRLLRYDEKTAFVYDEAMKTALSEKLSLLKEALKTGQFDLPDLSDEKKVKEICKYCRFDMICGKQDHSEDEGEDRP